MFEIALACLHGASLAPLALLLLAAASESFHCLLCGLPALNVPFVRLSVCDELLTGLLLLHLREASDFLRLLSLRCGWILAVLHLGCLPGMAAVVASFGRGCACVSVLVVLKTLVLAVGLLRCAMSSFGLSLGLGLRRLL